MRASRRVFSLLQSGLVGGTCRGFSHREAQPFSVETRRIATSQNIIPLWDRRPIAHGTPPGVRLWRATAV